MFSSSTVIVSTCDKPSSSRPSSPDDELRVDRLEAAAEGRDAGVLGLERRARMASVDVPGAGRDEALCGCCWSSEGSFDVDDNCCYCNRCSRYTCVVNNCVRNCFAWHRKRRTYSTRNSCRLAGVPARPLDDAAADQPRPRRGRPAPPRLVRRPRRAARRAGQRLRQVELAERVLLSTSGLSRLLDRIEKKGLVERTSCDDGPAQLLHRSSPTRAREMLEEMWPVYARGIADDFLPALGSNPCEIRADARGDRRPVRRRPRGRRAEAAEAA